MHVTAESGNDGRKINSCTSIVDRPQTIVKFLRQSQPLVITDTDHLFERFGEFDMQEPKLFSAKHVYVSQHVPRSFQIERVRQNEEKLLPIHDYLAYAN